VTQRPQGFVGKAIIVAIFLFPGNPDSPERVTWSFRGNSHLIILIYHLPVGIASAIGNPGAPAGLHYRVQGSSETAGRYLGYNLVAGEGVYIGLPVGYHHKKITR
jgi:hypothetical protein